MHVRTYVRTYIYTGRSAETRRARDKEKRARRIDTAVTRVAVDFQKDTSRAPEIKSRNTEAARMRAGISVGF